MTAEPGHGSIESVLQEGRVFPPPEAFAKDAHVSSLDQYEALWNRAKDDPEGFWAEQASNLHWFKPWTRVLEWNPPFAKWFVGGQINASYNCVDRHCEGPMKNKAAIVWEGEPG
ncbi:MAG: acetyl-coenzyme A synthetase N-terminal domain-containing protein, partial [Isosphaeraceae bacterium]